jgi:hypothetical protein
MLVREGEMAVSLSLSVSPMGEEEWGLRWDGGGIQRLKQILME